MDDITTRLIELLNDLGIIVDENNDFLDIDSVEFISLIIQVEEIFGIQVPEDLLLVSAANSIEKLSTIIENLMEEQVNV